MATKKDQEKEPLDISESKAKKLAGEIAGIADDTGADRARLILVDDWSGTVATMDVTPTSAKKDNNDVLGEPPPSLGENDDKDRLDSIRKAARRYRSFDSGREKASRKDKEGAKNNPTPKANKKAKAGKKRGGKDMAASRR